MKRTEAIAKVGGGGVWLIGEYRLSKAETVHYRDKVSGKSASFSSIVHHLETGNEAVSVQERVPDGADLSKFKAPWNKGQKVLVEVKSLERVGGFLRASGPVETIDD